MKKIILLICTMVSIVSYAQKEQGKTALLLIDIQKFYFAGGSTELVNPIPASVNAQKLLAHFRETNQLVVHIKHGDGLGAEIHPNVAPLPGEKIIIKHEVNSFISTDLLSFLHENGITRLVLCGMQTHMCLEAATRAGADFGFKCIVIQDACATRDLSYKGKIVKAEDVQISTLATLKVYAQIMDTDEYLSIINE
jgi:nicotinamidase-related amidase